MNNQQKKPRRIINMLRHKIKIYGSTFSELIVKNSGNIIEDWPWRRAKDPFLIMITEMLLQRTRRSQVLRVYNKIVSAMNKHGSLCAVLEIYGKERLIKLLKSLGLMWRVINVIKAVEFVCERYGGRVPSDTKSLTKIPGVGQYVSRAVLCLAFGEDVAMVDTNVERIVFRFFLGCDPPKIEIRRNREFLKLIDSLIPKGNARVFNLTLIDLGSKICLPTRPNCRNCPLNLQCKYAKTENLN